MRKLSVDEMDRLSPEEFKQQSNRSIAFVLDNVRSMHNIGSAFRTADAFSVHKIYLCGITACPPHRDIQKTALGATESVEWEYQAQVIEALQKLKAEGYQIIAVEQAEGSILLPDFQPEKGRKVAFVFGNEVTGLSDEAMEQADLALEIPQFGTKHSLNVSVSIGVVCWHFLFKTHLSS
jgi:23S rRNA (guanosine2251-2'-O)-methyltransferase